MCRRPRIGDFICGVRPSFNIGLCHANIAVARVVVRSHTVLDDIYTADGATVRYISPYCNLDLAIEQLKYGSRQLAFTEKMLKIVAFHQVRKFKVEKLFSFVSLYAPGVAWVHGGEYLVDCRFNGLGVFGVYLHRLAILGEDINHSDKVPHFAVVHSDALHIRKVGFPLRFDPRYIGLVPCDLTARGLVQRIGLLALKVFLDQQSSGTWNMELFDAPKEPVNTT